ncbi:MAG: hypothetical protein H6831_03035 [Planctomycetes bacterium]|nr:hypothetical protein [Planctomycetota bacterium]MCB9903358.1 hypothetical protein [Planctomycetota bacterium]
MENEPVTRVVIYETEDEKGDRRSLAVELRSSGELVMDGCDSGPLAEKFFGDWDYEYWRTVPADRVGEIALRLIAERFGSDTSFRAWLDRHGIPSRFDCWR